MKKVYTFAASNIPESGILRLYAAGIFCALSLLAIYGFVPPCGALMRPQPSGCWTTGKAEPFFISPQQTILSVMSNTERIASSAKQSSVESTPDCESVKIFSFDHDTSVEIVLINGEPYFVAVDVCNALDLQNPTNILKKTLDKDEYLPYIVYRLGQQRLVNVVNESGLYNLIFQSRKPNARKFRKWITSEVLPAIRKRGVYLTKKKEESYSRSKRFYELQKENEELKQMVSILNTIGNQWKQVALYNIDLANKRTDAFITHLEKEVAHNSRKGGVL
jgi:prophage antirepressor-like protein